jgi:hypothetical protein
MIDIAFALPIILNDVLPLEDLPEKESIEESISQAAHKIFTRPNVSNQETFLSIEVQEEDDFMKTILKFFIQKIWELQIDED